MFRIISPINVFLNWGKGEKQKSTQNTQEKTSSASKEIINRNRSPYEINQKNYQVISTSALEQACKNSKKSGVLTEDEFTFWIIALIATVTYAINTQKNK